MAWNIICLLGVSTIALHASGASARQAEEDSGSPAAQKAESIPVSDIVVTGTRLRSGMTTPTPVVVNSAEQLRQASPGLVGESLSQLPALRSSGSSRTLLQSPSRDNGATFLNLRGLGKERTLVLLNGRRSVPSSTGGAPDVNLFPQDLVQRVETTTGGASAAYGSDAVAGVVNYILDTKFTGLRMNGQMSLSDRQDAAARQAAISAGTPFADGRGHALASFDFYKSDGVPSYSGRKRLESGTMIVPSAPGASTRVIASPFVFTTSHGGMIPDSAANGILGGRQFAPDGTLVPFNFGTLRSGSNQIGGDGQILLSDLSAGIARYAGFGRLDYELTDDLTVYAEGSYAKVTSSYSPGPPIFGVAGNPVTIFNDNAFLSPEVKAQMAAGGITSFTMRRLNTDFSPIQVRSRSETFRAVGGLDWKIAEGWDVSAYVMHGQNRYKNDIGNNQNFRNLFAAADAVFAPDGRIVCRSTLAGLDPGCVPINLFGEGAPSAQALAFVLGTSHSNVLLKEDVADLVVRATPFALPAGPVNIAFGGTYRREAVSSTVDALTATPNFNTGVRGYPAGLLNGVPGLFQFNNAQPLAGSYKVSEGFVEAEAPILSRSPLAHSLTVNGAVRYIHYSTVGGVTSWKVGATYEPFEDLRFRAIRSRDIRAGNAQELFTQAQSINTLVTRNGVTVGGIAIRYGNPKVRPEKADTITAGMVYRPSWFPGFALSVDYFDIKVRDAITQLTNQQTIDACDIQGSADACSQISSINGVLTIRTPTLNLGALRTRGVDFELSYQGRIGSDRFGLRGLATYVGELSTQLAGFAKVDRAGDVGTTNLNGVGSGTPHWIGSFSANYETGVLTLFAQERIIGGGKIDNQLPSGAILNASNHVDPVLYTDISVRLAVGESRRLELYGSINNLFDRIPPIAPNLNVGVGRVTNPQLYDVIGRYFSIGARVTF